MKTDKIKTLISAYTDACIAVVKMLFGDAEGVRPYVFDTLAALLKARNED